MYITALFFKLFNYTFTQRHKKERRAHIMLQQQQQQQQQLQVLLINNQNGQMKTRNIHS